MTHESKLAELRARTDRQLAALMRAMLEGGLRWARACAGEPCAAAERAYAEALALLPALGEVSDAERRRLECKLAQLRDLLDKRPVHAMMRMQAAC